MELGKEEVMSRKATKGEILQIVFLIIMLLAIAGLVISIIQIYKYKEMLGNPLGYNLDKFGMQSCRCLDNSGKYIDVYSLMYKPVDIKPQINLTFNFS